MPSLYTLQTINNAGQAITMLEDKWRALTETHSGDIFSKHIHSPHQDALPCFMSWEWLTQWLQTYQDYIAELKIICILHNDETIAIAPFYIGTNKAFGITTKTLAFIATNEPEHCEVASEFIDIAYSRQHKQKIIELLTEQLLTITNVTQLHFKELNKQSLIYSICQKLKPQMLTYNEYVSGYQFVINTDEKPQYSTSFLKRKKRTLNKFKKLSNSQNCQFIIAKNKAQSLKLYEQLVLLHQKRWQQQNKLGVFSNIYFYQFHKHFIETSFDKDIIVLSAIQIDNQIISVNYSIKWHNILYFYQSGIDESFKPNLSPGLLNHLLLIQYCEEQQIQQYNLLKSAKRDDYKSQFAQLGDELIDITILPSNKLNLFWFALSRAKQVLKRLIK